MHKKCKLTPLIRKEIYQYWQAGMCITWLADQYHVTRPTIYKILKRGRINDFSVHKSMNNKYRKAFYGLKKIEKSRKIALGKLAKQSCRYEKNYPGEMVHIDSKTIAIRTKYQARQSRRECLFVLVDDYSRYLFADILPRKNMENATIFLNTALKIIPFPIDCIYSDNGSEFKGSDDHDFMIFCKQKKLIQKFTRPKRPQTNGKAERVIRTILEECLRRPYENREIRRKALVDYVQKYNQQRFHSALKIDKIPCTPCQLIQKFLDAKVYTTR